jgi:hypothetical protein
MRRQRDVRFALDAAHEAWQAGGVRVTGCALAARAAAELQDSAAIRSATIKPLQLDIRRGYGHIRAGQRSWLGSLRDP